MRSGSSASTAADISLGNALRHLCIFFDSRHRGRNCRDAARTGFWLSLFRFQGATAHKTLKGRGARPQSSPKSRPAAATALRFQSPGGRTSNNSRFVDRSQRSEAIGPFRLSAGRSVNLARPKTPYDRSVS